MSDGTQVLRARESDDSSELLSPSVGVFTPSVAKGELVAPGQPVGVLDVLGVRRALIVPEGTAGRVGQRIGGKQTRVPVQYGDVLITVSTASVSNTTASSPTGVEDARSSLSFIAPMSGRFYGRPSPNEPPFVEVGGTVTYGQTVGLLEVMKTFNRLVYQGDGLPEKATVGRVVPSDGDDVVRGDPILLLGSEDD